MGATLEHGIDARQLRHLSAPLVSHQQLEVSTCDQRGILLDGHMRVTELQPGMRLRLADVRDRFGLTSRGELPAGVKIALVIEGAARVRYGQHEVRLGPGLASQAVVATLPITTPFVRMGEAGGRERTLTLGLSPNWLARHGYAELLEEKYDAMPPLQLWRPSSGLLALTARLFTPQLLALNDPAHYLQLNGLGMALAGEALMQRQPTTLPHHSPHMHARSCGDRRLMQLMELIDAGQTLGNTQEELARRLGMSLSNLQRRFRAQRGEPLGQFLRRYHLGLARNALARERVEVETAAALAGYASAPNFATAFKREFGMTPSECRTAFQ